MVVGEGHGDAAGLYIGEWSGEVAGEGTGEFEGLEYGVERSDVGLTTTEKRGNK